MNLMNLRSLVIVTTPPNLPKFPKLTIKPNHKRIQVWVGLTASHITKTKQIN